MDLFLTRRDSPIAKDCRPINSDSQACSNNYFVLFLFLPVAKCRPQVLAFSCAVQCSSVVTRGHAERTLGEHVSSISYVTVLVAS